MWVLTKGSITPLMLKKNPQIVQWVSKLCRYSEYNVQEDEELSVNSQRVRKLAEKTLDAFKTVMDFKGSNIEFMPYVWNSFKLFNDLTKDMSEVERRQVAIDPEIEFFKQSIL